jgi:hypothetical protein
MKKGLLQRNSGSIEHNGGDLREKLSRNRKNLPRYDPRGHAPELRARYDMRDKVPEPRPRYSSRDGIPESRLSAVVASRVPSARSADDLMQLESSRNHYSSWVSDGLRHRSPEVPTRVRGDASPLRAYEQIRSMPSLRSAGASRAPSHTTRDASDTLRSQPYTGKSTISVDTVQRANGITSSSPAPHKAPVMVCICTFSHRFQFKKASGSSFAFWLLPVMYLLIKVMFIPNVQGLLKPKSLKHDYIWITLIQLIEIFGHYKQKNISRGLKPFYSVSL